MQRDGGAQEDQVEVGGDEVAVVGEAAVVRQRQLLLEARERLFLGVAAGHDLAAGVVSKDLAIAGAATDADEADTKD